MSKIWTWISGFAVLLSAFCMVERALEGDISASLAFGALTLYNICYVMARIENEA